MAARSSQAFISGREIALKKLLFVAALALPTFAFAADKTVTISGGQASTPVGLTVQVKGITIGDDATKVHVLASFDSHKTNSVNMNDNENAYLSWGEGQQDRLHMRQIADNRWMRIANGQTMEGELLFPGTLPADVTKVTLVFNPGRNGEDTNAPGITLPLEIRQ